jgi:hypothetical protein
MVRGQIRKDQTGSAIRRSLGDLQKAFDEFATACSLSAVNCQVGFHPIYVSVKSTETLLNLVAIETNCSSWLG